MRFRENNIDHHRTTEGYDWIFIPQFFILFPLFILLVTFIPLAFLPLIVDSTNTGFINLFVAE